MLALTLEKQSWAHSIPVGWKLLGLFALTALLFPVVDLSVLFTAFGCVCGLYASLGHGSVKSGFAALKPLAWFGGIILFYHWVIGDFTDGAVIVVKMVVLVALANFVTMTSRLSDMMDWILWVLSPLRFCGVRTHRIALAFALVIRFTPTLSQRGAQLAQAWRARSKRRVGLRIVMPLAVGALDDAENIAEALRARGGVD